VELEDAIQDLLAPDFEITIDKHGQVIILTGLRIDDESGELVPFEEEELELPEDEDDEDEDD